MSMMDFLTVVSFLTGVVSIVLAVFAMYNAKKSEKSAESNLRRTDEINRDNFQQTQDMMREFYDKTKELLAEIDKRTVVTEKTVADSQEKLLSTFMTIVNETVIPKKGDMGEKFGMMFLQQLMSNPQGSKDLIEVMSSVSDIIEKNGSK